MGKDEEGKKVEWIAFSVHAREGYRVNEERETKFVIGFEKGKKVESNIGRGRKKKAFFFAL